MASFQTEQLDGTKHDVAELHQQLNGAPLSTAQKQSMSTEQKDLQRVAKRIIKAIKEPLEEAQRKEAELKGIPFEKEMNDWANLDARLENAASNSSARVSLVNGDAGSHKLAEDVSAIVGASPSSRGSLANTSAVDVEMKDVDKDLPVVPSDKPEDKVQQPLSPPISASSATNDHLSSVSAMPSATAAQPIASSVEDPWARGGVPWYMNPFDPVGTTVYEERWTGPEQMRAMSEALSEMDEETLQELNQDDTSSAAAAAAPPPSTTGTKASARRQRRGRSATNGSVGRSIVDADAENEQTTTTTTGNVSTTMRNGRARATPRTAVNVNGDGNGSGGRATRARAKSTATATKSSSKSDHVLDGGDVERQGQAEGDGGDTGEDDDRDEREHERELKAAAAREKRNAKRRAQRRSGGV